MFSLTFAPCFVFSHLQPLPLVPKVFSPSVACPSCFHANDAVIRFCQMCGYRRKIIGNTGHTKASLQLDIASLDARLAAIHNFSAAKSYSKQKSSLQKEVERFLSSLLEPRDMNSASPQDLCRFLVWKDRKGKIQVHDANCPFLGQKGVSSCNCPTRLAFGTVDSLIAKLRTIFKESGRVGEWDIGSGNPASGQSLHNYVKTVRAEQLQSHTRPQ